MRRRIFIVGALLALTAVLAFAQEHYTGGDPWWRPLNPGGQSYGITVGNALPTTDLVPGELALDVDAGPILYMRGATAWTGFMGVGLAGGTQDQLAKFGTTGFTVEDSLMSSEGVSVAYVSGDYVDLEATMTVMDAGNTIRFFHIDMEQPAAGHDGAADIIGLDLDINANDVQATDIGVRFDVDYDFDIQFLGDAVVQFPNLGGVVFEDAGQAVQLILQDTPADNADPVDILELDVTASIMDAALDVQRLVWIDLDNVNHTNGAVWGLTIDIDTPDAQADEHGLVFNGDWDNEIMFGNGGNNRIMFAGGVDITDNTGDMTLNIDDVPAAGATGWTMWLDAAYNAMDGGDTAYGFFIDLDSANHAGANNFWYSLAIDDIVDDAQSYDTAMRINQGYDAQILLQTLQAASDENPPTTTVAFFVDDSADYSGAGGNDCAFVARNNDGDVITIAVVELNAACP